MSTSTREQGDMSDLNSTTATTKGSDQPSQSPGDLRKTSTDDQTDRSQGTSNAPQQEPVKFEKDGGYQSSDNGSGNSRRVTIGGGMRDQDGNGTNLDGSTLNVGNLGQQNDRLQGLNAYGGSSLMDRRNSMSSIGMDDFFSSFGGLQSRRGSMAGFDALGGVDSLFGPMGLRRDSIDSANATLDAALMDLHRRRFSMGLPPFPQEAGGLPVLGGGNSQATNFGNERGLIGQGSDVAGSSHDSLAARQAQLHAQQREIERKQKMLELERQRMLDNIRQRSSYGLSGINGLGSNNIESERRRLALMEMENMGMARRPSFPYTSGGDGLIGGGGMGASSHSHLTSVSLDQSGRSNNTQSSYYPHQAVLDSSHRSAGGVGSSRGSNWHICQFCSSRAFASLDEAMAHESVCLENPTRNSFLNGGGNSSFFGGSSGNISLFDRRHDLMQPPLHHPGDRASRNFSLGMDTSQRSMLSHGMEGLGGMDGPIGRGLSIGLGSIGPGMDVSQRSALSVSTGIDGSQRSDLSLDRSNQSFIETPLSNGPFTMLQNPMPLAMDSDKDWLTPLHCFVRRHCVEVFTATDDDVSTPSKGKRKPIHVGQIGIRCPHCHRFGGNSNSSKARERGSVYYPTTIKSIYNATMNLLQRHLHSCPAVPEEIMRRYETLKADDARSGTSKRYWEESAISLGLVDTINGIRFSALRPPPLPSLTSQQESTGQSPARRNSNEFFSTKSNAVTEDGDEGTNEDESTDSKQKIKRESEYEAAVETPRNKGERAESGPLVTPEDTPYSTLFSYNLLGQMQPCVFTEADRLGKRKGLPPGFPGLACRHCFGGYGSGRFFPSSIKTLSDTSKTLNVLHNHMMRCRKCPAEVRENLEKLRGSHDEERAKMKFGSQKAFFARIWERLHGKGFPVALKRSGGQPEGRSPKRESPSTNEQQMIEHHKLQMAQQQLEFEQQFQAMQNQNNGRLYQEQVMQLQNNGRLFKEEDMQHQNNSRLLQEQSQHYRSPMMMHRSPHHMPVNGNEGLEALAAATSPSKRQRMQ